MNSTPWGEVQSFLISPAADRKKGAALILGLSVLVLFAQVLFSSHLLVSTPDGDLANQFLGWRALGFEELKKGHLTLWNPFIYCGTPYFSGFQSALLYPPNWTFLFLPLIFALNLSFALHVFLAGFFTYLWLASHRLSFLPALLGAFVFMFGGAFYAHLYPGHLPNLCAMAWIPLVFRMAEKILEDPVFKNILLGASVISLQLLAGHPQYFLYSSLFVGIHSMVLLFQDPADRRKKLLGLTGTVSIAAALTAIQWLPGLEAAKDFGRDFPQDPRTQGWFALDPRAPLWLLAPGFNREGFIQAFGLRTSLWWESCLFIGFGPLFFMFKTLFGKDAMDREAWLATGLAVLALLLALGPLTPLYPLLTRFPLFGSMRGSFKFDVLFQLFAALLAARGIQNALASSRVYALPLGIFSLLQLFYFALNLTPSFDTQRWAQNGMAVYERTKEGMGDGRIYWEAHNDRAIVLGLPSIWGDDPFPSRRYQIFLTRPPGEQDLHRRPDEDVLDLTGNKMALTRLAYLATGEGESAKVQPSPAPRMERFNLIGAFQKVDGDREALEALADPKFNPAERVLLEEAPDPVPLPGGDPGRISIKIHSTDHFEFTAQLDRPKVLLMTDTYAPGWKASALPGSSQMAYRVLPADIFARAIPLAAGTHHFDLVYDPPGFALGKAVSSLTLFLVLWVWGFLSLRRKMGP